MSSEVVICNLALAAVRGGSINSLDEQRVTAQLCKQFYPICRDMMLEGSTWGFNRAIDALALLTDAEVFDWSYVYQYPADCLYINRVIPDLTMHGAGGADAGVSQVGSGMYDVMKSRYQNLPLVEHQVLILDGTKVLVCNEPRARVDYRKKITDPALFPHAFQMALANLIGAHIAVSVSGEGVGAKFRQECLEMYTFWMGQAALLSASEQHKATPDSEFIDCYRG